MNLLIEILILSIFCNGLYIAAEDHMILEKFRRFMEKRPKWIYKPIIGCIYCMASFWGVSIHGVWGVTFGFSIQMILTLPIIIIGGCFVNGLVRALYDLIYRYAYGPHDAFFDFNKEIEQHEGKNS